MSKDANNMKTSFLPVIPLHIAIISALIFLNTGCAEHCDAPKVLNPIPDTTVAVGDTLLIDLEGEPPVFSEEAMEYHFHEREGAGEFFEARYYGSTDIRITGLKPGEGNIEVLAECGWGEASSDFIMNIIVTENNGEEDE